MNFKKVKYNLDEFFVYFIENKSKKQVSYQKIEDLE